MSASNNDVMNAVNNIIGVEKAKGATPVMLARLAVKLWEKVQGIANDDLVVMELRRARQQLELEEFSAENDAWFQEKTSKASAAFAATQAVSVSKSMNRQSIFQHKFGHHDHQATVVATTLQDSINRHHQAVVHQHHHTPF